MKKKGFTLVELLAVIAILAILVIIALPNIMDLFNQAKKNSFLNEVKELHKTAQAQWMSESLNDREAKTYARGTDCPASGELKLSGRSNLNYIVDLNQSGEVTSIAATDGTFIYMIDGNPLTIESIVDDDDYFQDESEISEGASGNIRCNPENDYEPEFDN